MNSDEQVWDSLPADDAQKLAFRREFDAAVDANKFRRRALPRHGRCAAHHGDGNGEDKKWAVHERSCWKFGCAQYPLAKSTFDEYRNMFENMGVRAMHALATQKSYLRIAMLPEDEAPHPARPPFNVKQLQAQLKREPRLTCMEIFGPGLCRTKDAQLLTSVFEIHKRMWEWCSSRWQSDTIEGQLVAGFRVAIDGHAVDRYLFCFLSRRVGSPRKLVWTIVHPLAGDEDAAGDAGIAWVTEEAGAAVTPRSLELQMGSFGKLHLTSHALIATILRHANALGRLVGLDIMEMLYADENLIRIRVLAAEPGSMLPILARPSNIPFSIYIRK